MDFSVDYSLWITSSDSLVNSIWFSDSGISIVSSSVDAGTHITTVRLSGGTVNGLYEDHRLCIFARADALAFLRCRSARCESSRHCDGTTKSQFRDHAIHPSITASEIPTKRNSRLCWRIISATNFRVIIFECNLIVHRWSGLGAQSARHIQRLMRRYGGTRSAIPPATSAGHIGRVL